MQIKISFHNMEHSTPLENHAKEKLEKLHDLLKEEDEKPPFFVEFWLKSNKLHPHHSTKLHLKTSNLDLNAHDEGTDLYVVIDNTIDKMVKLVRKNKTKKRDKQRKSKNDKGNFTNSEDKYTLS